MKNKLITSSSSSNLSLNFPDGEGVFSKGVDGRSNPFEKREYNNGNVVKMEQLHSGYLKVTAKVPNPYKK